MLKNSVRLPRYCFQFIYLEFKSNKQTFNMGRAYYSDVFISVIAYIIAKLLVIDILRPIKTLIMNKHMLGVKRIFSHEFYHCLMEIL